MIASSQPDAENLLGEANIIYAAYIFTKISSGGSI